MTIQEIAHYSRQFVDNRQIDITHFYPIGVVGGKQCFSVGYVATDDIYVSAVYWHDEQGFHKHESFCIFPG